MNKNLLLLSLACMLTTACHGSRVVPATVSATLPVAPSEPVYKLGPQPTEAELREVIQRNYEDAVTIASNRTASFLIGDFNGDHSEDVAIVVEPVRGKLSALNSEYANWILEDPHQSPIVAQKNRPIRPSVRSNDLLLAVIHGHEREGWRNALARQTYLLKDAVGEEFEKQSAAQLTGSSLPRLRGDVIREKLEGTPGIIFWTGARYVWHPSS